jgi:glycerol kinase
VVRYLLAIDQGTTGSTALVLATDGRTVGRATREFPQHFPEPGWVEHEPDEIWDSVVGAVGEALSAAGARGEDIAAIGITNQRETTLVWERDSGRALGRAIVWQDRRTAEICGELRRGGHEGAVREATGLVLDPYFSGTKVAWLLDHTDGARARADRGELAFGTVDSYLAFRLAGGARTGAPHVTDVTNASRTLLMNLERRRWDTEMCRLFRVPEAMLPSIVGNATQVAVTAGVPGLPDGIPIAGMAGDQHAALYGQACFSPGDAKCTYGTGAFLLVNTGTQRVSSRYGLLSTMGYEVAGEVAYALEGSVFIAGAAVQWLRDGLGVIRSAAEIESLARSVASSDGVVFVPALSGLGAPHWDAGARGLVVGITRGTTRAHLARATLEAIALQVDDVLAAMSEDLGRPLSRMRVDGGAAENDLLLELQASFSNLSVDRPTELESTARGAAMLAGVGVGLFKSGAEAAAVWKLERSFDPGLTEVERQAVRSRWLDAVRRARSPEKE